MSGLRCPVRWLAAGAAAALAVAAGGCDALSGRGVDDQPSACAVPTAPPAGTPGPADAAPGGGGLRVVEKGFTQLPDTGPMRLRRNRVSIGAVVENTSAMVAYRARVSLGYTDAHGRPAFPDDQGKPTVEVPVIHPGQRVPVGFVPYVGDDARGDRITVAEVQVTFETVRWAADDGTFPAVAARPQSLDRDADEPYTGTVVYTTTSDSCRTLTPRGVGVVFRNTAGTVVGGSFWRDEHEQKCEPGRATESTSVFMALAPDVDLAKSEVLPYCDLAPPPPRRPQLEPVPPASPSPPDRGLNY